MRGSDKISVFINSYTCDPCMISIDRVIRSVGNIRWLKAIRQMLYAMFLKSEKYISVYEGFEKKGALVVHVHMVLYRSECKSDPVFFLQLHREMAERARREMSSV